MKDDTLLPTPFSFSSLFVGMCVFLLCWGTFITYYHFKFDLDIPPSTSGDEPDYDSIAWEISQGRGFALNYQNAEFRAPYDQAADDQERFQLQERPGWHVTYRPPLYPYAISFLNRLVGRQFWATRMMDAAFMAGTLALIAITVYRSHGLIAVSISTLLFMIVDTRTRLYGRAILTEAMSLFLTTLICVLFFELKKAHENEPSRFYYLSAVIGLVFGLSLLTRTMMITWIPGIIVIFLWISHQKKFDWRTPFIASTIFLSIATLVFFPWAIRNINATGKFMPLGTQGQVQLSAAFGEIIWKTQGEWGNLEHDGFFDDVINENQSPLEQELIKAEFSKQKAIEWIIANPLKSIALIPMKLWKECHPRSVPEAVILLLAGIGCWNYWRNSFIKILVAIFLINLMGVAATWSVQGRFLVPVLFPIHILATLGSLEISRVLKRTPRIDFNP